ncbi:MAG: hypothetical protein LBR52_00075 [Prevotellaceae bacterium]|jgi:hypothetical protein|nr:hypothetical protein [Prevotellaceae bacterium]
MISKIRNSRFTKAVSILLLAMMLLPMESYAITGGPSQPEFTTFTPVEASDMVDLFSGDFQYNIPLLDVEGYPVNLSYNSGIGMEDQASIVGLGWTLNAAGIINRTVRGIPDDFNGKNDKITTTTYLKPTWTVGTNISIGNPEIVGGELPLSAGFGILYNNYTGFGYEASVGVSVSSGNKFKFGGNLNLGLGLSLSGDNGVSLSPSANLSYNVENQTESSFSAFSGSLNAGTSFNSRSGLRQVTMGVSASKSTGIKTTNQWGANVNRYDNINSISHSTSIPIGTTTYIPQMSNNMKSYSMAIDFGMGIEAVWINAKLKLDGYFSRQALAGTEKASPAYGYLYSEAGKEDNSAMHDFNREKDGAFTKKTPALAMTQMTYDIYSVSGQGITGMFRPFREFGTVYDPYLNSSSGDGNLGLDLGAPLYVKGGINVSFNANLSESGRWSGGNNTRSLLSFNGKDGNNPIYENVYFKNAGEFTVIDDNYYNLIQGVDPVRIDITKEGVANKTYKRMNTLGNESSHGINGNSRNKSYREKRNLVMSYLTASEAAEAGLEKSMYHYPLDGDMSSRQEIDRMSDGRKGNHISEITVNCPEGTRYVYGNQTYNYHQEEVSFNVDRGAVKNQGFVEYTDGKDNKTENGNGIDHYYNKNVLPPHATAYLLTAILTPDYVDLTANGPTDDDLGNYTKFNYTRLNSMNDPYRWRNPYGDVIDGVWGRNTAYANYQDGFRCKRTDDKGNYLYGKKEIKLLHSIETKNYIAKFYYADRQDAWDVMGENGGRGGNTLKKLTEIRLFSRQDLLKNGENAEVIKAVHFDYDYSLCKGIPSNPDGEGKLTLKKVWFTYGASQKGIFSPYEFTYNQKEEANPSYHPHAQDRWGNYMPNPAGSDVPDNVDAPYVKQSPLTDQYAQAWNLTKIELPSGGIINVEYESDDYAYVQDERAARMMPVLGFGKNTDTQPAPGKENQLYEKFGKNHYRVFVETDATVASLQEFRQRYIGNIEHLFFKFFIDLSNKNEYEYVMGYAKIQDTGWEMKNGKGIGWIQVKDVSAENLADSRLNPIAKTAMQFVRINMPDLYFGGNNDEDLERPGEEIFRKIAGNLTDITNLFTGVHKGMSLKDFGKYVDLNKSFIRLKAHDYVQRGGGLRVKKLMLSDSWDRMSGNTAPGSSYGQIYSYTRTAGPDDPQVPAGTIISSGVASYEPFVGNEENPLRKPDALSDEDIGNPDGRFYKERPYGEMFYPSPTVGYSHITVTSLDEGKMSGKTEHEFYTAKDFPVIVRNPHLIKEQKKSNWVFNIFKINVEDNMTTSQSYAIELNDMHGKPKAQRVYAAGQETPISEIEYFYKKQNDRQLANTITTINKAGKVQYEKPAGIHIDLTIDERENKSFTGGGYVHGNLDASPIPFPPLPIPLPSIWGGGHSENTRYRSITGTKVITRYGILQKTVARDLGSEVTTENLAWDAETGEVLLTSTQNSFNDTLYSFTYPAHWGYDGMAPAYKNISVAGNLKFGSMDNARFNFAPGDELHVAGVGRAWVDEVSHNRITVLDEAGEPLDGNTAYNVRVIRSGRRNQQTTPIGTVTTLRSNPLRSSELAFENVLNAGAVQFRSEWDGFCGECTDGLKNPYLKGAKGSYRPWLSHVFLTGRSQSDYNRNTSARRDGVFTSFLPFWVTAGEKDWQTPHRESWTFASEVTLFSPYGFELENRDALHRYTSASYGYNNTLPTAVSANSRYSEMGFTGFEDALMNACESPRFGFDFNNREEADEFIEEESHTGRHSIRIGEGESIRMTRIIQTCVE